MKPYSLDLPQKMVSTYEAGDTIYWESCSKISMSAKVGYKSY